MKTDERWIERLLEGSDSEDPGTKALVAVEGFFEPGRECVAGELVLPWPWCGRRGCSCGEEFHGIASHGNASVARVRHLRGAPRALIESTIAAAMRRHDDFDRPARAAAALLAEVAEIEVGRLVRREEGILLPFPAAARITRAHQIEYRLSDEP